MTNPTITVTPVHVGELAGVDMPIYVHLIDHPQARVLVDTGLTELHPAVADMDPQLRPPHEWGVDLASVDLVVNTHLHFDHCGGNHLFAGTPTYVQRQELEDGRTTENYLHEWVDPPGSQISYVPVDGELELLPGVRLMAAPGHTRGSQIVVVDGADGPVIIAGDTAVWFGELDSPQTEGQRLIRSLEPHHVWLSHAVDVWRPTAT